MNFDGFARDELEKFFSRQEERGKFYCGTCLAIQLMQRGARKVTAIAWTAAVEEAFMQPSLLQVRSGRRCDICQQPRLTIGGEPRDSEVDDALVALIRSP